MSNLVEKAKRYHSMIREILLKEWDPIGISHVPEAQDEYDSYVGEVYRLISRRVPQGEIFDYLWWAETKNMGLCGNRQKTEQVSAKLVNLVQLVESDT